MSKRAKIQISKGEVFGRLTILRELEPVRLPSGQTNRVFECRCSCGKICAKRLMHLRHSRTKSCGCESTKSGKPKHGKTNTPLYQVWRGMKNRMQAYHNRSHRYKEKGITICQEWDNDFEVFEQFALQNGYKDGLQIDRKDNSKGYFPENCRFVSVKANCNNRDITLYVTYRKEKQSLKMLLFEKGLDKHYPAIYGRIKRGWDAEKAIDTPIKKGNYITKELQKTKNY